MGSRRRTYLSATKPQPNGACSAVSYHRAEKLLALKGLLTRCGRLDPLMLLVLFALAFAADPQPRPGIPFHDALSAAKTAVYDGDYPRAASALSDLAARLEAGEEPGSLLATEAMLYFGDVQFVLGDKEGAKSAFEWVLSRNANTTMSPYDHAEDVRSLYALVREEVRRRSTGEPVEGPQPIERPGLLPARYYLPFGVASLRDSRRSGARWNTLLQTGLAAGSVTTFIVLDRHNFDPDDGRGWTRRQVTTARYGVQWPLTVGFYAAWTWSIGRASKDWRNQEIAPTIRPSTMEIRGEPQ